MSNNISTAAMTADQRSKCHAIIHTASASAAAVGAGLAQLPGSDNAAITPIQLAMTVSQVLVGWIPGLGNAINASTAAALTESVGWLLAKEFASQSWAD